MIKIIELRVGNYCHVKKNVESSGDVEGSKLSAIDKIRKYYNSNNSKPVCQILSIKGIGEIEVFNTLSSQDETYTFEEIYPVRLDSKIIRDCGFHEKTFTVEDLTSKFLTIDGVVPIRISEYREGTHFSVYVFDKHSQQNTYLRDVIYLHQLQNLYFALSDEFIEFRNSSIASIK